MTLLVGKRTGSNLVDLNRIGKTTKWLDISSSVSDSQGGTVERAEAVFYADSDGNWHMRFNISTAFASASVSAVTFTFSDLVFRSGTNHRQAVSGAMDANSEGTKAYANPGASTISVERATSAASTTWTTISGDVELDAEPTVFTIDANMESGDVQASIKNADDSNPGLLSYQNQVSVDLAADPNSGSFTGGVLKLVRIDKAVILSGESKLTHGSAGSVSSLAGLVPADFRPTSNTTDDAWNEFYRDASGSCGISVKSDGQLLVEYYNDSGAVSRTDTVKAPTMVYTVP